MTGPLPAPARPRLPLGFGVLAVAALVALWFLRSALAPFFMALVLAYLLEPLVSRLASRLGREWASILVILGTVALGALVVWALVPVFWAQAERLVQALPGLRERAATRFLPWLRLHPAVLGRLSAALEGLDPMALVKGAGQAGASLVTGLLDFITLILVPLILYYLLMEGHRLRLALDGLVPPRHLEGARRATGEINRRLGGYIRGQLAVALVMSFLQGLVFQVLGVPFAWLLGLVAGFSNVVPYTPYLTALPPALLLLALGGAGGGRLLALALVFTGVQKTETLYFTPVWVGRASGLHPLEVLLAILCSGYAFGILGLIFAVPLMIVLKVVGGILLERYRNHPWFLGGAP